MTSSSATPGEPDHPSGHRDRFDPKVFGIGFHKTATSSLAVALETLGYDVFGHFAVLNENIGNEAHDLAKRKLPDHDAFLDDPWHVLFRELDRWCPDSKFILTVRDPEAWIESVTRHFGYRDTPMRRWIYGVGDPIGHEELYVRRYQRHIREVKEHFRDRPDDLLVLDVTDGEGWEKLCPFLGHPVRQEPFPRVNTAEERETLKVKLGRLKRMAVSRVARLID